MEKGRRAKERINKSFKNANLMTVKLLINVIDIPLWICVSVCVSVRTCVSLWGTTLGTAKADYEIKWDASGK